MDDLKVGKIVLNDIISIISFQPTTSWFDDEIGFGVYPHASRDAQPRIYKRSLYERVASTMLEDKDHKH